MRGRDKEVARLQKAIEATRAQGHDTNADLLRTDEAARKADAATQALKQQLTQVCMQHLLGLRQHSCYEQTFKHSPAGTSSS